MKNVSFWVAVTLTFICSNVHSQEIALTPVRGANFSSVASAPNLEKTDEGIYFFVSGEDTNSGNPTVNVWRMELDGTGLDEILVVALDVSNPSALSVGGAGQFTRLGSRVIFSVDGDLYSYSLNSQNTAKILDLQPSDSMVSGVRNLIKKGNQVFFTTGADDQVSLWQTSGTIDNTSLVLQLPFSGEFIFEGPGNFTLYKGKLYFTYDDGITGNELWISDGSAAGTSLFLDIDDGIGCGGPCSSGVRNMSVMFDRLIFDTGASFNAGRSQFWVSDGTVGGTVPFFDLAGGIGRNYLPYSDRLLVTSGSDFNLNELWSIGNSTSASQQLLQLYPESSLLNQLFFESAVEFAGKAYFGFVTPGSNGIEGASYDIWESNGTQSGTRIVLTRQKPSSAFSIDGRGLFAFSGGIVFVESVCDGNMMNQICSTSILRYDGIEVSPLLQFSKRQNVFLQLESILTTDEHVFVAGTVNGKLTIYSTNEAETVNVLSVLQMLLDDRD